MVTVTVKAAAVKPKYIITLGGTTEMVREERDVQHGTAIFRDVLILAMPAVKTDVRQLFCCHKILRVVRICINCILFLKVVYIL